MGQDHRQPNRPTRYCRQCQYVLDGLAENRCPECGTPFDPNNPSTYLATPKRPWRFEFWTDLVYSAFCIVLTLECLPSRHPYYCQVYDFLPSVIAVAFAVGLAISGCRRGSPLIRVASLLCLLFSLGLIAMGVYAMLERLLR